MDSINIPIELVYLDTQHTLVEIETHSIQSQALTKKLFIPTYKKNNYRGGKIHETIIGMWLYRRHSRVFVKTFTALWFYVNTS